MAAITTSTETTVQQTKNVQPLSHEELMAALKKQIEYYFSQENLCKDVYLVSQMNDAGYVPLAVIANFRKVKELTMNMEAIMESLKGSECVVVDVSNLLIKPTIVFERKTVILRDTPAETTEEEVRSMFDGLATVESIKAEFGNTWFVVVDSEKSAISSIEVLRQRTLHDAPIKARVKNESYLKNLLKLMNTNPEGIPAEFIVPQGTQPMMFMPYMGQPMMVPYPVDGMMNAGMMNTGMNDQKFGGRKNRGVRKDRSSGKHHDRVVRTLTQPKVLPQLQSSELFPPLVPTSSPKPSSIQLAYSKEDILAIVKQVTNLSCPPLASDEVHEVMIMVPNQELVSKGRTFSIDQAVERGIPRSLSVDSVDYTSMMHGEIDEAVADKIRKSRKQSKHQPKLNYKNLLKNSMPVGEAIEFDSEYAVESSSVVTVTVTTDPSVPIAPAMAKKEAKPAPKKMNEKKGKKPDMKPMEKKSKPKTEDDGWTTIERKH